MSPVSRALAIFVVIELITTAVWGGVEIKCPSIPGPPATLPPPPNGPLIPSVPGIYTSPLNPSCFGIDFKLNVENILPDPSHIARETNMNVIKNVISKTLIDNNINSFHINPAAGTWSNVNNQCPQKADQTAQKFILPNKPYEISCDDTSLTVGAQFIECEFTTPTSTAYQFNIASITSFVHINPSGVYGLPINMAASIMNAVGTQLFLSDTNTVVHTEQTQEFVFAQTTKTIALAENTNYKLRVFVTSESNALITFHSVHKVPVLNSIATASPCLLAANVAVNDSMKFAVQSLCNSSNAAPAHRSELERVFYQKSSAQTLLSHTNLVKLRRRLRRKAASADGGIPGCTTCGGGTDCKCSGNSLHCTFSNSTTVTIANDSIVPYYRQCLAVDIVTNRVFSVGGEYVDGLARNELKVYQIESLTKAKLTAENILLDRARTGSMCYFWNEYIVVINGMGHADDMSDAAQWYNDIVFVSVDATQNNIVMPRIKLKYNVMDMRPVITGTNILYLFGGRDADNAQNYIQAVDLSELFVDGVDIDDVFTTVDRMEAMIDNVVIPFVDFVNVNGKSCLMLFGGQNYVNKEWISIDIPAERLQLICNDNIAIDRNLIPVHQFSEFDLANLESVAVFDSEVTTANNVFLTDYHFENDDIWYEFSASFEVCLPAADLEHNEEYLTKVLNVFESASLVDNILYESQRNYREWNDGFSAVEMSHINFIRKAAVGASDYCSGLSLSACNGLVIAQNGGDQECAFNHFSNECYSIQRQLVVGSAGNLNEKSSDNNSHAKTPFFSYSHSKLYAVVGVLSGVTVLLLLCIVCGACFMCRNKRKTWNYSLHENVSVTVVDGVDVNTNSSL